MLYTEATKGAGYMDMNKCDLSVEARVGQLRVVALFLFINRLLGYFKQFDVSKKAIESAKKSAQEGATAAMSAVSCVPSQIHTHVKQFLSTVHTLQLKIKQEQFTMCLHKVGTHFNISSIFFL